MHEILILTNVIFVHLFLTTFEVALPLDLPLVFVKEISPAFARMTIIGLAIRFVCALLLGRGIRFLESIASVKWAVETFRLIVSASLGLYCYLHLKIFIPLVTSRVSDQFLWDLDRLLFGGLSPNVFFLNVFGDPKALFVVDWTYHHVFRMFLYGILILGFSSPVNRVRIALVGAKTLMWIVGAWSYYVFPSMGPAYRFADVWSDSFQYMPLTRIWQARLLDSYQAILGLKEGVINPWYGIGAFPSLHVALHVFCALIMRLYSRIAGVLGIVAAIIIFVGSIVSGWHYLVDSVAGVAIGILFFMFLVRYYRYDRYTYHWRREFVRPLERRWWP